MARPDSRGNFDGLRLLCSSNGDLSRSLVLLVDQFEEVFSICPNADHRTAFIENLRLAALDASASLSVVLTVRTAPVGSGKSCRLGSNVPAHTATTRPHPTTIQHASKALRALRLWKYFVITLSLPGTCYNLAGSTSSSRHAEVLNMVAAGWANRRF